MSWGTPRLLTPDVAAASMGIATSYAFFRWSRAPSWQGGHRCGCRAWASPAHKDDSVGAVRNAARCMLVSRLPSGVLPHLKREAPMVLVILGVSLVVLNMGYGFEGSAQRVDAYKFQSQLFGGPADEHGNSTGSPLTRLGLGKMPVPLPANYVQGIDTQRLDFERTNRSYLNGRWRVGGWPHFYLVALAIKDASRHDRFVSNGCSSFRRCPTPPCRFDV